jgi:hypothetical protein
MGWSTASWPGRRRGTSPSARRVRGRVPALHLLAGDGPRAGRPSRRGRSDPGQVEAAGNELGLFAEELDVRSGAFLGNYPLLFSQVEYIRVILALNEAREAAGAGGGARGEAAAGR